MPIARFQMSDGRVARFEVPEGTTPEQAQAMMAQHFSAPAQMNVDPTADMSTTERLLAGAGRGMTAAGRAALQGISKALGADSVGAGLVPQSTFDEARKTDAALMNTTAGKVGNVAGMIGVAAPTALIPGANTALGAGLIGGGLGALTTEGDALERAKGAGLGAAGGVAGKYLGDALGTGARWLAGRAKDQFNAVQAATAQRMAAAKDAAGAGFVIPPADLQPGMLTEALSGLSGKIKTAQVASQRNQNVTNDLARQAVGLPAGTPITADALQAIRADAGKAYDAVRGAGQITADQQYGGALDTLANAYKNVMPEFPGLARSDVPSFLGGLKRDAFDASTAVDAIRLLRARADQAYRTGDSEMGKAAKAAAAELEALIERNLQAKDMAQTAIGNAAGKLAPGGELPAGTLQNFRDARQLMAKTYTVEKALNPTTGDVSAQVLAAQLAKGKPLSGDLLTVAQAAQAFPKALQALKEAPKATSPLDWAVGALGGTSTGNPLALATVAARPAVRSLLLSPAYQRAALQAQSGPGLLTQLPAGLLDQNLTRNMMPGIWGINTPQFLLAP